MKRSTKYVGLDVHQATTVASVREESGKVIARSIVPTQPRALVELVRGMRGAVHVALEEGTQAQWLHDLFAPVVHRVVVCDRRREAMARHKADHADADALSERLRCGTLRAVYHGSAERAGLKELARTYLNLVEDATRAMLRLKAIFRARGIPVAGRSVYDLEQRAAWVAQLPAGGARFRAEALYAQLELFETLRPQAKTALVAEARRDPAWRVLRTIPYLGPVRVALLLAVVQTPWRFRTKRQFWAYAGLAVVTRTSAEFLLQAGRPVRRARAPLTRGLNRNHNRVLKWVLKGAATTATTRAGALQDFYQTLLGRGMRPELARVTLTRKLAALTLRLWKTGAPYDPAKLTVPVS